MFVVPNFTFIFVHTKQYNHAPPTNNTNLRHRDDLVCNTGMKLSDIIIEVKYFLPLHYDEIVHIEINTLGCLIEFNN